MRILGRPVTFSRLRRGAARAAIVALIANIALPVIVALSFAPIVPASSSPFPICSAHLAILGDAAPSGPAEKPMPVPLGCPLCPAPMPAEIPAVYVGLPSAWGYLPVLSFAIRHVSLSASLPSPIWPQAPPAVS